MKSVKLLKTFNEFEKYFEERVKEIILDDKKWYNIRESFKTMNCVPFIQYCIYCPFSAHNAKLHQPSRHCINYNFKNIDYYFNLLKQMREIFGKY